MNVVQLAGAPDLLQTNEAGEFRYGSMSDGARTYAVLTYGRIVTLTRQAIINDDLRALSALSPPSASRPAGWKTAPCTASSRPTPRWPTAPRCSTPTTATSSPPAPWPSPRWAPAARPCACKGLRSEELNLAPAFLIVPATLEQTAYNLTSANYVPSTKAEINEFRAGGHPPSRRWSRPVLDASSTSAWYLAASSAQVDTVSTATSTAPRPVIDPKSASRPMASLQVPPRLRRQSG